MNSEHLQDVRGGAQGTLGEADAVGMVLAAYDHELFHPWRPGMERTWKATLDALMDARGRILAGVIVLRLREYQAVDTPLPLEPLAK